MTKKPNYTCKDLEQDDIVEITRMDECKKIAKMLGKNWKGKKNNRDWTRNCNYWAPDSDVFFNKYAGNNKGDYSQQACKKEVLDTKSP